MAGSFFLSVGKQSLGSGTRFTQQVYKCQGLTLVPATWTVQKVRLHFWGEVYFPPVAKRSKLRRFCTDLPLTLAKAEYPWQTADQWPLWHHPLALKSSSGLELIGCYLTAKARRLQSRRLGLESTYQSTPGVSTIVKMLHSEPPPPNRLPVYFPIPNSGVGFPSLGASCCTSTA